MQDLKNKNALITGAGKGLGKAMALELAKEGVNIALAGRTEKDLLRVAAEISAINSDVKVQTYALDVSDYTGVQDTVKSILETFETIDILINSAGVLAVGGINELPVEQWEQCFKINVFGTYYMIHEVFPEMVKNNGGDIINIASTSGLKGSAKMSAYGASKAAVINLTESVMQEGRKSNIRVSTINPSTIATDMTVNANFTDGNEEKVLQPEDLATLVVHHLKLPKRAFVKEFSLWSTNP